MIRTLFAIIFVFNHLFIISFCTKSLFFLGDSTSMGIFDHEIKPYCNGTVDPKVKWPCEDIFGYWKVGMVCDPKSGLERIGIMMHWGVSSPPYHNSWGSHRARLPGTSGDPFLFGDTENSVDNIYRAFNEFQQRTESPAYYIFMSNLWYVTHRIITIFLS
jgi:hypothetical protein